LKERRVTWTFSYTYFEGKENYLDILLPSKYAEENVQVTLLSFKIGIGECPSISIPSKYA
jgi:hypothetical protein